MTDIFSLVESSIQGLDVELVDVERAAQGLLRVTIDRDEGVRIEDCEAVSRQLSRVFEVEGIDYARLEVGSPGVDRPLRRVKDFVRFSGERIEIKLRLPFNGQKVFKGVLVAPFEESQPETGAQSESFGLELDANKDGEIQVLRFTLDEIERAKIDPVLNFRGKKR